MAIRKIKASRNSTDHEEWALRLMCKKKIYITLTFRITTSNHHNSSNTIITTMTMYKYRVDEVQRVEGHWQQYGRMSNS